MLGQPSAARLQASSRLAGTARIALAIAGLFLHAATAFAEGEKGNIQEVTGANPTPFVYPGAEHMIVGMTTSCSERPGSLEMWVTRAAVENKMMNAGQGA